MKNLFFKWSQAGQTVQTALFLALALLVSSSLVAQSPQGIPYQAVMRNADGSVMASSEAVFTFMIHDVTANGTVVYQESHSLTSNAQGLVSCVLGNGTASQGNFANINWGSGAKFLHVMMNGTDLGTQQLLSVPYALYAEQLGVRVSATGDALVVGGNSVIVPGVSAANFPPAILGCTDNTACNYNSTATQNDNSCLYFNATCDDGNANTTNDVINSNCVCAGTQTSGSGTGAQLLPGNATCSTQNISVTGCGGQTALTYDGRTYGLVEIGGQCWFADNLATDQYRNGESIPTGLDNTSWQNTTSGAFAIYNNDPANDVTYGKLYNWYTTVDSRGLCPMGWHVPSDCEWMYLESSLGMSVTDQETSGWRGTNEGGAMKATTNWTTPNTGATNSSGFTAFPGGFLSPNGTSYDINNLGYFWSSTDNDANLAWYRFLNFDNSIAYRSYHSKRFGFSVRCVRDSETPPLQGCTDGSACNFMANANQDDGSCLYLNATCDDGNANTINDIINGSCVCAGTAVINDNVVIGQDYQGGKVAYIFQPGDAGYVAGETHGLIAAAQDLPGTYLWGCLYTDISGAADTGIGAGAQNTLDIVNAGCGGAAQACADLVLNGYSDWFLPSIDELAQLYSNRNSIGGFQNSTYWSSSEADYVGAWRFNFSNGNTGYPLEYKNVSFYVRAVRAF